MKISQITRRKMMAYESLQDYKEGSLVVKDIYTIFHNLERGNNKLYDDEAWKTWDQFGNGETNILKYDFPWTEVQKHFDGVHHFHVQNRYDDNFLWMGC
jgi:hypothetical protein